MLARPRIRYFPVDVPPRVIYSPGFKTQARPLDVAAPVRRGTTLPPGELTLRCESRSSSEPSGKPDEWPCKRGSSMNSTACGSRVDLSFATCLAMRSAWFAAGHSLVLALRVLRNLFPTNLGNERGSRRSCKFTGPSSSQHYKQPQQAAEPRLPWLIGATLNCGLALRAFRHPWKETEFHEMAAYTPNSSPNAVAMLNLQE